MDVEYLKKLVLGLGVGYIISWLYFFITLPFFIKAFGKTKGAFINYILSWIVWIVAGYCIGTPKPAEEVIDNTLE
jgi:hypothetical protein